jgi:hypothetical protein
MKNHIGKKVVLGIIILIALLLFWAIVAHKSSVRDENLKKTEIVDITKTIELELSSILFQETNDSDEANIFESSVQWSEEQNSETAKESEVNTEQWVSLLQYLRSGRESYTTDEWILLCGDLDQTVQDQLNSKDITGSFASLRNSDTYEDPLGDNKGQTLDYIHLCATLNAAIGSFSVIEDGKNLVQQAGWMGDLLQAVSASEDVNQFGTDEGSMNLADINADLDAANLFIQLQEGNSSRFYLLLQQYYFEQDDFNRKAYFLENYYPNAKTQTEQVEVMYEAIMDESSPVLEELCKSLNVNRTEKADQIRQACVKFVSILNEE